MAVKRASGFYSKGKGAYRKIVPVFARRMFGSKGIGGPNPEPLDVGGSSVDYALLQEKSATYEVLLEGVKQNLLKYMTNNIGSMSSAAFEAGLGATGHIMAGETDLEALTTELAAMARDAQSNAKNLKKESVLTQSISNMSVLELRGLYSQLKKMASATGNNEQVVQMLRQAGELLGKTSALQKVILGNNTAGKTEVHASNAISNEKWHEQQIQYDKQNESQSVATPNEEWHQQQIQYDQQNEIS